MVCIFYYNIAYKRLAVKENKIYGINKILAEKYEEEINFKRDISKMKLNEFSKDKIKDNQKGIIYIYL